MLFERGEFYVSKNGVYELYFEAVGEPGEAVIKCGESIEDTQVQP